MIFADAIVCKTDLKDFSVGRTLQFAQIKEKPKRKLTSWTDVTMLSCSRKKTTDLVGCTLTSTRFGAICKYFSCEEFSSEQKNKTFISNNSGTLDTDKT